MSDSESSSAQTQKSLGVNDESITDITSGGPTLNIDASAVENLGKGINITYAPTGFDSTAAVQYAQVVAGGALDAADGLKQQTSKLTDAIAAIAQSVTGTQSESGAIINKLAMPAMILAALFLFFRK